MRPVRARSSSRIERDEKPGKNEEEIDPDSTAGRVLECVNEDDEGDRDGADPV